MSLLSSKSHIHRLFNEISTTYDLVNKILSCGLDVHWRRSLVSFIPKNTPLKVLDLATGTGDQLLSILKNRPLIHATGVDLAEKMLELAKKKHDHLCKKELASK